MSLEFPFAEDVALIGQRLEVRLPDAYIKALAHYPFPLDSDLARVILYADPQKVVERNDYRRQHGFFGHAWPRHFLIIGDFGDGDLIFLDTTRTAPSVFRSNHELSSGAADLVIEDTGFLLPEWITAIFESWQKEQQKP